MATRSDPGNRKPTRAFRGRTARRAALRWPAGSGKVRPDTTMWLDDQTTDIRWTLSGDLLHLQRACQRGGVPTTLFRPDQSEESRLPITERTATMVYPSRDCPSARDFMIVLAHLLVSGQPFGFHLSAHDIDTGILKGMLRLNPSLSEDALRMLTRAGLGHDREAYERIAEQVEEAFSTLRRQITHAPLLDDED